MNEFVNGTPDGMESNGFVPDGIVPNGTVPDYYREPKYTFRWLGNHVLFVIGVSVGAALLGLIIDLMVETRFQDQLISSRQWEMLSDAVSYCFGVNLVTLASVMLVEICFKKPISYVQYILIGCALTLFFMLLLAITEFIPLGWAYLIVSVMTIGLITGFVFAMVRAKKGAVITASVMALVYALLYVLISFGAMTLLIGSVVLFLLITLCMVLTLKLRLENDELTLG